MNNLGAAGLCFISRTDHTGTLDFYVHRRGTYFDSRYPLVAVPARITRHKLEVSLVMRNIGAGCLLPRR